MTERHRNSEIVGENDVRIETYVDGSGPALVILPSYGRGGDIDKTPFIAGDPPRPDTERLAALRKAFFAPGHDPQIWLAGWYPATLAMQRAAAAATAVKKYWSAGGACMLEIIPRHDPFKPQSRCRELSDQLGDRVTTVLIDDAAHALFPEQPTRVAQAVLSWMESSRPSAG